MRDMIQCIEDLTNPVEMGFRKELKLSPADLDDLDKKMKEPASKVEAAMKEAKDDSQGLVKLPAVVLTAVGDSVTQGTNGIAAAYASAKALRKNDPTEALKQL